MDKVILNIRSYKSNLVMKLRVKGKTVSEGNLTIDRDLDIMLITTLDRILSKHRIGRLSLKRVEIRGKMPLNGVSGMVMEGTVKALSL
ncbi:MAG: hypothetical protein AAB799_01255 [Patescibacteria group bacterium]